MILVTGAAGFIGSHFVTEWLAHEGEPVVSLDLLTYAGRLENLADLDGDGRHVFVRGDIADRAAVERLLSAHRPRAVVHFAAESHVDRSIRSPEAFVATNELGTCRLLETACAYWERLGGAERDAFRFLHVSTDEVYGSREADAPAFTETTPYAPRSPYAASKAASDHWVRAFHHTYGLPVLVTHASNNYGPRQLAEKFLPVVIEAALANEPIPIYGDGLNERDWLYVTDHCAALRLVLAGGRPGETYDVGTGRARTNLEVAHAVCDALDAIGPHADRRRLVTFVRDRPGHDRRYAVDATKLRTRLGWAPRETFESGLGETVRWFRERRGRRS
jgi:dTDP-glucose 4,6-dehydratase